MSLLSKESFSLILILSCLYSVSFDTFSQNIKQKKYIISQVASENLAYLQAKCEQEYKQKHSQALKMATQKGWLLDASYQDGGRITLKSLDFSGVPLYYITDNINAANTISTNQVWSGGRLDLNLSGDGITIGIWDGGKVRDTHQELNGRVVQQDSITTLNDHATHVAGTIVAAGVVTSAKGMAFKADLDAYDWNNDEAEMARAALDGLMISNHSYSFTHGWAYGRFSGNTGWHWFGNPSINSTEDFRFGFYSNQTQLWDDIAHNAPMYMIIKAAGNDRDDNGPDVGEAHRVYSNGSWVTSTSIRDPDGNYDCIGTLGTAKNILTVGAVQDIAASYSSPTDVQSASFSGWGPTNDGRIKPDVVANGVSLYSTSSSTNNSYATRSGTSMSSPSVTGSMALLQEHYSDLNDNFMRAASLKGLVIHTADEAGIADGPDYSFGWGLMNTEKAANLISQIGTHTRIEQLTLNDDDTISFQFKADTSKAFAVTISWTDVPGTPATTVAELGKIVLVNDLDIRVYTNDTTYMPWTLDPANPASAATTGDNFRDNIENIVIDNPIATETYTVVITHKDSLSGGSQDFSFIASGIEDNSPSKSFSLDEGIIAENQPLGTTIGYFDTQDDDIDDTHTYTLVGGVGNSDNTKFKISGDTLKSNSIFNYEKQRQHSIRVETSDGNGGLQTKIFNIEVLDANDIPSALVLSNNTIAENQPLGTTIGYFDTQDDDIDDTHTYTLVEGVGNSDNTKFKISGDTLKSNSIFNYEKQRQHSIRVETSDGNGGLQTKIFNIEVLDANDIPSALVLSNNTIAENQPLGTTIGYFDTQDDDIDDTHTYTLVEGVGNSDNTKFKISGDTLKSNSIFNYEKQRQHSIRVETSDGNSGLQTKIFNIEVLDANDIPSALVLSNNTIAENQPLGTTIGYFDTQDDDIDDTHTYTLVEGVGNSDNTKFKISGDTLKSNSIFNYEKQRQHSIRVETSDGNGGLQTKIFNIEVLDANDIPSALVLSNNTIAENQPLGTTIGYFDTQDDDIDDTHTYTLVEGVGNSDNTKFKISGDTLKSNSIFNYKKQRQHSIRVETSDGNGGLQTKIFNIEVLDANDIPSALVLSNNTIAENQPLGTTIGKLNTIDEDISALYTYRLINGTAHFYLADDTVKSNITFDYEEKSSYNITISSNDGDGRIIEKIFTITITDEDEQVTSVETKDLQSPISVYPNPVTNKLNIKIEQYLTGGEINISVINVLGETIREHTFSYKGVNTFKVNVSDLAEGLYLLQISNDKQRTFKQFIKR